MAKRKRPRIKDLKQGQTIWVVTVSFEKGYLEPVVNRYLLYSHNEPLPEERQKIKRMPANYLKKILFGMQNFPRLPDIFYKEKAAIKEYKRLKRKIENDIERGK